MKAEDWFILWPISGWCLAVWFFILYPPHNIIEIVVMLVMIFLHASLLGPFMSLVIWNCYAH
jgi:hypothetical protein